MTRREPPELSFASREHTFRLLRPDEEGLLAEAADIDAAVWGGRLRFDAETFRARALNGYLIGAFERESGALAGTLTALRVPKLAIEAIGHRPTWAATWDGITGRGTLSTHQADGEVLACVAVTARSATRHREHEAPLPPPPLPAGVPVTRAAIVAAVAAGSWRDDPRLLTVVRDLCRWTIERYLLLDLDYVIRFHHRAKGGVRGAGVWRVVEDGRPADQDAMGYNVVLRYPRLMGSTTVTPLPERSLSVGEGLVLAAYELGARLEGVQMVAPYSRPAAFRRNLLRALVADGDPSRLEGASPPLRTFAASVAEVTDRLIGARP